MTTEQLGKLAEELKEMYEYVQIGVDENPEAMRAELRTRSAYLARSAEMMADLQRELDVKRGAFAEEIAAFPKAEQPSATLFKELLAKRVSTEQRLYNLAERLNAALVHQIDAVRTDLSYAKQLLERTS